MIKVTILITALVAIAMIAASAPTEPPAPAEAAPAARYFAHVVEEPGYVAPMDCPDVFTEKSLNTAGTRVGKIPPAGVRDCNLSPGRVLQLLNNSPTSPAGFSEARADWE